MRFQVPQFIEVEDKIFGPLTLKQFIYLVGGGGISFLIYVTLNSLILAFIPIALVMGISAALAFYRINNKPLVSVAEYAFKYIVGNKLYIWKKKEPEQTESIQSAVKEAKNYASVMVPKISDSRLNDLTWSLDIKEKLFEDEK